MQASNVVASILRVNSSSEATVKLARIADSREECLILLVGNWGNADCSCSDLLGVGDTGLRDCTRETAIDVMRTPVETANPATCFLHGQVFVAQSRRICVERTASRSCARARPAPARRSSLPANSDPAPLLCRPRRPRHAGVGDIVRIEPGVAHPALLVVIRHALIRERDHLVE